MVISQALYTVLAVCECGEGPSFTSLKSRFHGMNYVTKTLNLSHTQKEQGH